MLGIGDGYGDGYGDGDGDQDRMGMGLGIVDAHVNRDEDKYTDGVHRWGIELWCKNREGGRV